VRKKPSISSVEVKVKFNENPIKKWSNSNLIL